MATSTLITIIVVAVVVALLIAALSWLAARKRKEHRRIEADRIREMAAEEEHRVGQREAIAEETEARARAAAAEADAKKARAAGLQQQAATHRSDAAASRDELNQQFERADEIDPDRKRRETT